MTLLDQIHQWYQAGEHEHTVNAVLSLPGRDRTDRLLGELILAYNNLGQYSRALLVLDELKPRLRYTWTWQYRRGYALYYSAYGASGLPKVPDILAEADALITESETIFTDYENQLNTLAGEHDISLVNNDTGIDNSEENPSEENSGGEAE